jgi:hypothetical protein
MRPIALAGDGRDGRGRRARTPLSRTVIGAWGEICCDSDSGSSVRQRADRAPQRMARPRDLDREAHGGIKSSVRESPIACPSGLSLSGGGGVYTVRACLMWWDRTRVPRVYRVLSTVHYSSYSLLVCQKLIYSDNANWNWKWLLSDPYL